MGQDEVFGRHRPYPDDSRSGMGKENDRQLDRSRRHQRRSIAAVHQQARQNLGTRFYAQGDLGNCESEREKLRSANSRTARLATDLCAALPPGRR
jgi:hypothetical protein